MITRRKAIAITAAASICSASQSAKGADATAPDTPLASVFRVCAYSKADEKAVRPAVRQFAEQFGCSILGPVDQNPRCCVWFELVGTANPGHPGWIFLHHSGGSICYATDAQQMRFAVERLVELMVEREGHAVLPEGVTTSFPVTPIA